MGSWSSQSPRMTTVIHLCSQRGNVLLRGHTVLRKRKTPYVLKCRPGHVWVGVCICYVCVRVTHAQVCVLCVLCMHKFVCCVCYACTSLCCACTNLCVMHAQVCVLFLWHNSVETVNIYSCTRPSAVVTLTCRKAEYTTDVWSLWKIAHGKVVSVCVLKGSGPLSHPLSLPFPLQVW